MRFAFIFAAILSALMIFGCIGSQVGQSTGAANLPDRTWYSDRIVANGTYGNISLGSAVYRHVYSYWTTNNTNMNLTANFSLIAAKTCSVSPYGAGAPSTATSKYNDTALNGANGSRSVFGVVVPERNTTLDNVTIAYQNTTGDVVTVRLNGYLLGTLNNSVNSKTFAAISAGYLINGTNIVSFVNNGTLTNITNITIQYVNTTAFNCSLTNVQDGNSAILFEVNDTSSQFNITLVNATLNNTTTFNINVYGGDIGVVTDTGRTYIGAYDTVIGGCNPLGHSYPLAWNTTDWTNITGLPSSRYAYNGKVILCLFRTGNGNISNYGLAVDYVGLSGNNTYAVKGIANTTIVFQTSLDNRNWFTETTTNSVASTAQRIQANNTGLYARFVVSSLVIRDPAQDGVYIQYVGVSN